MSLVKQFSKKNSHNLKLYLYAKSTNSEYSLKMLLIFLKFSIYMAVFLGTFDILVNCSHFRYINFLQTGSLVKVSYNIVAWLDDTWDAVTSPMTSFKSVISSRFLCIDFSKQDYIILFMCHFLHYAEDNDTPLPFSPCSSQQVPLICHLLQVTFYNLLA